MWTFVLPQGYVNDSVQDCNNSSAYALELLQPCTKASILELQKNDWEIILYVGCVCKENTTVVQVLHSYECKISHPLTVHGHVKTWDETLVQHFIVDIQMWLMCPAFGEISDRSWMEACIESTSSTDYLTFGDKYLSC